MGYSTWNGWDNCAGCNKRTKGLLPCSGCLSLLPAVLRAEPYSDQALRFMRDRANGFVSPGAPLIWAVLEFEPEAELGEPSWLPISPLFRSYREAKAEAESYGIDPADRWYSVWKVSA